MNVADKTFKLLHVAANARALKQNVLSSNVANAETPGYKAQRVDFEKQLQDLNEMVQKSELSSDELDDVLSQVEPMIYDDPNGEVSENGNTVNVEKEILKMTDNKIMYDATVDLLKKKIGMLKYVINSER